MSTASAAAAPPPETPTLGDGAAAWAGLCAALQQRARLDAQIVELTGVVQRSGTIEALEGVVLDTALNLVHRLLAADRSMQLTAADVLADMPATARLFADAVVSWGQVRGIVAEAKRLSRADRAALDARIAASVDLFPKLDADDAVDAVRVAAHELRDRRAAQRSEDAVARANFLWAQPGMFGPATVYGQMDNASLGSVLGGIDAHAPVDDGRPLSQRRADGLVAMALHRCPQPAGSRDEECPECAAEVAAAAHPEDAYPHDADDAGTDDATGGPAAEDDADASAADAGGADRRVSADEAGGGVVRMLGHRRIERAVPALTVAVDISRVSVNAAGVIELDAPGCLPTLTARTVEALAADAAVRVVLFDGGRPLAVTKKVHAKQVPGDVRLAVKVRDGGDRFPGSRRRIEHLHHLDKDRDGHHPDAIVGLAGCSHRRVHRHGWSISTDPATAEATFTRGERVWTTLPKGTRLRRPPPRTGADPPPLTHP